MLNHSNMKLGKNAPKHDKRTLKLASYITHELPTPPEFINYASSVTDWPMYKNDVLGDCTICGAAHMVQGWTNVVGDEAVISDNDVVAAYTAVGGYNPEDPTTDNGATLLDVLKYWRANGIGTAGHKIGAYASVSPGNTSLVKDAIYLFGGLYIGVALPLTAQDQLVWDVDITAPNYLREPNSFGGHCVNLTGYSNRGLTCVTWGAKKYMTWEFFETYCDEAYAILTRDWLDDAGKAPNGLDVPSLRQDLNALASV